MNADVFLDSNILIYAVERETTRSVVARNLLVVGGTINVQVLNECASVLRRKLHWTWPEISAALVNFRELCAGPHPLTLEIHEAALTIAARDGFNIYDALIVAAALDANCRTLMTEDMQDGRILEGRLTLCNPFASAS